MTILTTEVVSGPYTASADTTFAVDFQSISEQEIRVELDGDVVSPAAYTFNRDEDGTGELVMGVPVTGEVMIYSDPDFKQQVAFSRFGPFYPDQINAVLDRFAVNDLVLLYLIGSTVGPEGPQGEPGAPGVDGEDGADAVNPNFSVATGAAGSSVLLSGTYPNLTLTIPRGNTGDTGPQGPAGTAGTNGTNATNPNFTVATGAAGTNVTLTGTYPNLTLTIPRGDTGLSGAGTGDLLAANNLSDLANAATARTNLGLAIGTHVQAYDADLATLATSITAFGHSIAAAANAAAGRTLLGLGSVDNTADTAKPVSTAQQAALDAKLDDSQATATGLSILGAASVAAIKAILAYVKGDVGLGNVDNTSDANKPVSTAQQAALDAKAPLASPALTGNPTAPTQLAGNATTRLATTEFVDRLRDLPLVRSTASPTAALTDRGGVVEATSSAALPANSSVAFPVGSLVVFYNDSASAITLSITSDTLRLAGTTSTGSRTIASYGYAYCRKRATTEWTVSGDVT